jgi:MFS transporter, PPP family, 3-phenylpropionic acid transporter
MREDVPDMIPSAVERAPAGFSLRTAIAFMGAFFAIGIMLPYFPVWLKTLALEDWQIGILLSLPLFLRNLTTPAIAAYADRVRDRADVLVATAVLALAATAALGLATGFWVLLALVLLQAILAAPHVLLIDAVTITGVRRYKADYAKIRVWGSIAFVGANVAGGAAIAAFGGGFVLPMLIAAHCLTVIGALVLPRVGRPRRPSPMAGFHVGDITQARPGGRLARPDFVLLLSGGALIHASHAMLYGFSAIHWSQNGLSGTMIGLLWGFSVVAEILLFQFASGWLARFSVTRIVVIGGSIAAARWLAFPFDLGTAWYFALQLLHAGSFAAVHLAQQRLILEGVSEDREAAAQGLVFFLNGTTMGTFLLASGFLYDSFGAAAFPAMALVALSGIICHLLGMAWMRRNARRCATATP